MLGQFGTVAPELMPITRDGETQTTYLPDVRTGVNHNTHPPARIVIYRPRIALPWELSFGISWYPDFCPIENFGETIVALLEKGGIFPGIGGFRPECQGVFGTFLVGEWEVEDYDGPSRPTTEKDAPLDEVPKRGRRAA